MKLTRITTNMLLDRLTPEAVAANDLQPDPAWIEAELDKREAKAKLPPKQKTTLSPSGLSLKGCSLEVWFGFYASEFPWIDPQPRDIRRQWDKAAVLGDWVHARWQAALVESGVITAESVEGRVYDLATPEKRAEIDALVITQNSRIDFKVDEETCGEIKGVADKGFNANDRYFPDKLKIDQAYLYQYFLGFKRTHFITINREAHSYFTKATVMEWQLEHDPVHTQALLNKAAAIMEAVYEGQGPVVDGPPGGNSYYCKNLCGYKVHCSIGKSL